MIIVNTDKKEFIAGVYGGKNFSIPYYEDDYKSLKELETQANACKSVEELKPIMDTFESLVDKDFKTEVASGIGGVVFVNATGKYHIQMGKGYSDIHIPDKIAETMLDNYERNIENGPLVNLCRRFMLNPKPTQKRFDMLANYVTQTYVDKKEINRLMEEKGVSRDVAEKMATFKDMQITQEGYLKTSKVADEITTKYVLKVVDGKPVLGDNGKPVVVEVPRWETSYVVNDETGEVEEKVETPNFLEDRKFKPAIYDNGDKFFSGDVLGYKYEVGKLAKLESWDQVSMTDGSAHEKGLHTGGLSYVEHWITKSRVLLDVFVCPSQIGKFVDNGCGEMTCKEMFIYGAATIEGTTRGLYHSSVYAAKQTDDMFAQLEEKAEALREKQKIESQDVYDMQEIAKALKA